MNIQTTQLKNQKKPIKDHSDWRIYCRVILTLILILVVIFTVANSYIYLNQQIQMIERDNVIVGRKIENIDREIKKLNNDYETASSYQAISRQIVRFNLKLREPEYSQIHHISLYDNAPANRKIADRSNNKNYNTGENSRRIADTEQSRSRH